MAKTPTRSRSSKKSSKSARKSVTRKSAAKRSSRKAASRKTASRKTSSRQRASSSNSQAKALDLLFPDLDAELATTRRMLERVPDGNNDWRPHAKSRTLGELATHLAQLPGFALMMLTAEEFDALAPRKPEPMLLTSAERVKMFDQLSAQMKAVMRQMTWDHANQSWTLRAGNQIAIRAPRSQVLRTAYVTHSAHHRAQVGVYLRMLEVPVPWTYGGSADEMPSGMP
jgi:uncharacterized damage-inducible protein DinB